MLTSPEKSINANVKLANVPLGALRAEQKKRRSRKSFNFFCGRTAENYTFMQIPLCASAAGVLFHLCIGRQRGAKS
jgi:hypothetical protein